jgi:S-DNA-T family DNA segregation ATPase FtsK/SpoIIIE
MPENNRGPASSVTAAPTMEEVRAALIKRLPPPDLNPAQLRARSWWSGADLFLLVDDYDLVAGPNNPVTALAELLPQARDIGLHVILARSAGGAGRAMFDPVIQRLKEMGSAGMIMSGSADEDQLLGGVRPARQPSGRGFLVERRTGSRLVQTALLQAAPAEQGPLGLAPPGPTRPEAGGTGRGISAAADRLVQTRR